MLVPDCNGNNINIRKIQNVSIINYTESVIYSFYLFISVGSLMIDPNCCLNSFQLTDQKTCILSSVVDGSF